MQITVDVITTRKEIYKALLESEDNQSVIGISSRELGVGMFMTCVKEIIEQETDIIVVLNSYDVSGHFFEKNRISFDSITGVIPFKSVLGNPFLKELDSKDRDDGRGSGYSADYLF